MRNAIKIVNSIYHPKKKKPSQNYNWPSLKVQNYEFLIFITIYLHIYRKSSFRNELQVPL